MLSINNIRASTESSAVFNLFASTVESVILEAFDASNANSTKEPYSNALHSSNSDSNEGNENTSVNQPGNKSSSSKNGAPGIEETFYRNIFIIICYSLIIFVSLCGNILVLRVIFSRKKLQTTTNLLIASLAFADVLTTTLNVPFNVSRFLSLNYPFGALFCKLVPFIQVACVYVSTLTMGVIAIHRHITLSCPHRAYNSTAGPSGGKLSGSRSGSNCRLGAIIVVVWLIAGFLAVPHSMFNQIVYVPWRNVTYVRCRAEYPKFEFNFPFWLSVEAFLTQYLIPLSITCTLYIKIGFVVSKQGRLASNSNNRRKKEQDDARRRRITMLSLVVMVFALCWFPLNLYHILVDFRVVKPNFNVFLVCHWIAMSSVCYNPFIYCWLNESFRKGAIKMLSFACFCCPNAGAFSTRNAEMSYAASASNTMLTSLNNNPTPTALVNNSKIASDIGSHLVNSQTTTTTAVITATRDERHGQDCPKAMKAATNCQKEKRKFRKLRLSSFRKNTSHHHHHHHHHHDFPNSDCTCGNANNENEQTILSATNDAREDIPTSGAATIITTAAGGMCVHSKAVPHSSSFESIISSINSFSNGCNSNGSHSSGCCSSAGCGSFSQHANGGNSSSRASFEEGEKHCPQMNLSQPCETVATTGNSTINMSTFV